MLDQAALPWFDELNRSLNDRLDDRAFRERIVASTRLMRNLAAAIARRAGASDGVEDAALGDLLAATRFAEVDRGLSFLFEEA
jgi:hypothetical protein